MRFVLRIQYSVLVAALAVSCTGSDDSARSPTEPAGLDEQTGPAVPPPPVPPPPEVSVSPERRQEVEDALEKAENLRKAKKLDELVALLESLGPASELPADLAATVVFYHGRALFLKGMAAGDPGSEADPTATFRAAEDRLAEVVRTYPQQADAASASYLLGSTRLMLDDLDAALKTYQETYDRFPDYEYRSRALLRVGVCLAGTGQPARATEVFRQVVTQYPPEDGNVQKAQKYLREVSIVGRKAPAIVADRWLLGLASGDGLRAFEGEVVVLLFFATWCENCEAELPHLRKLIDRWTREGAVFLGIANPEDPKNTSPVDVYVQRNQIPFHDVGLDPRWRSWGPYQVTTLPAAVVIDRRGWIAWRGHPSFFPTPLIQRLLRGSPR